jgi:hypothetical protein
MRVHALLSQPGALTAVGVAVALAVLTGAALSLDLAASAVALLELAPLTSRVTRARRRLHVAVYGSSADDDDNDDEGGAAAAEAAARPHARQWAPSPTPLPPRWRSLLAAARAATAPLLRQAAFSASVRAGQVRNLLCAPCARARRKYQSPATCPLPGLGEVADLYRLVFGYRATGILGGDASSCAGASYGSGGPGSYVCVGCYDGEAFSFTSGLADVGWAGAEVTAVRSWAEAARLRHAGSEGVSVHHAHIGTPATAGRAVAVAALPPHAAVGAAATAATAARAAAVLRGGCEQHAAGGPPLVAAAEVGDGTSAAALSPLAQVVPGATSAAAATTTTRGRRVSSSRRRCDGDGDGDGGGGGGRSVAQPPPSALPTSAAATAGGGSVSGSDAPSSLVHTERVPSLTLDDFLARVGYGHGRRRHLDLLVVGVEADAVAVLAGGGFTPAIWRPALVVAAVGSLFGGHSSSASVDGARPVDVLDALLCGGGGGGSGGTSAATAAAPVANGDSGAAAANGASPPPPPPAVRYRLLYRDPWASAWLRDDVVL